jgi:hypothetical protein
LPGAGDHGREPILEEKAMRSRSKLTTLAIAAAGLGAVAGPATAPAAAQRAAALSEFEGKVVSVHRARGPSGSATQSAAPSGSG